MKTIYMECFPLSSNTNKLKFDVFFNGKKYVYISDCFESPSRMKDFVLKTFYENYPYANYFINCTGIGEEIYDRATTLFPDMKAFRFKDRVGTDLI